jgi:hypothetical protein
MNIQYFNTNRLFYKKWIYKLECWEIDAFYRIKPPPRKNFPPISKDLAEEYSAWRDETIENYEIKLRREGPYILCFYLNDQQLLDEMIENAGPWIRKVYRPKNQQEAQALTDSVRTIKLCDKLHQGKYRYKVYLANKMNSTEKSQFLKWSDAYPDQRISVRGITYSWLSGDRRQYVDAPYIHVLDDSTLAMAGLFLGNKIKKTEEYVLRSTINIQSTDSEETSNDSV